MVSDSCNELLTPDYDEVAGQVGAMMAEQLRDFHLKHHGCQLVEIED